MSFSLAVDILQLALPTAGYFIALFTTFFTKKDDIGHQMCGASCFLITSKEARRALVIRILFFVCMITRKHNYANLKVV